MNKRENKTEKMMIKTRDFPDILTKLLLICFAFSFILIFFSKYDAFLCAVIIFSVILFVCYKFDLPYFTLLLFIIAFLVRVTVIIVIATPIVSDFAVQFDASKLFAVGDLSFSQSPYFQEWGGQIGLVIYQGLLLRINESAAFIELINCILTAGTTVLIYLIAKEFFEERASKCVALWYSIFLFPATFVTVLSNQHASTFLIFLAIYFIVAKKLNRINSLFVYILAAVMLSFANALRPDVIIVVMAIVGYTIIEMIHNAKKENISFWGKRTLFFIVSYIMMSVILSQIIIITGINSTGLKTDKNSKLLKFVFGTNYDTSGGWNENDTILIEDKMYELKISKSEAEIQIIKEHLSIPPIKIIELIKNKINSFWWERSLFWSIGHLYEYHPVLYNFAIRLDGSMFLIVFVLFGLGLVSREQEKWKNVKVYINPLIVLITFLIYLLIEVQPRYAYMAQVSIFIVAAGGIDKVVTVIKNLTPSP